MVLAPFVLAPDAWAQAGFARRAGSAIRKITSLRGYAGEPVPRDAAPAALAYGSRYGSHSQTAIAAVIHRLSS
jgi:hypothetical protein